MMLNRLMRSAFALMFVFLLVLDATPAEARGVREKEATQESAAPPTPMSPYEGLQRPYTYDAQTGAQARYWAGVMNSLSDKLNGAMDNQGAASDMSYVWERIERQQKTRGNKAYFTDDEARLLCIFVQREEDIPSEEAVPNWPASGWPTCGSIMTTMFGEQFQKFINENADDQERLDVYRALFQTMGISPKFVEATLNNYIQKALIGDGSVDLVGSAFSDEEPCYTAENNIQSITAGECGVLCTVSTIIVGLLQAASEAIYNATVGNSTFTSAVQAAMVLYVTIYGAMVVLGLAQATLSELLVRVAKLGLVTLLITSETSALLFNLVRCFFIEGTIYLVNSLMMVGVEAVQDLLGTVSVSWTVVNTGGAGLEICSGATDNATNGGGPLVMMETLLYLVFSPHMGLTILTLFLSSVEGAFIALFLVIGVVVFVIALFSAATVFLTSLIALYLLLSLMPVFLAFILFQRTRNLFDGWVSQLVGNALSPIFLFAYLSLFIVVVEAALAQILDTQICMRKWITLAWVFDIYKPQFVDMYTHVTMLNATPIGFFEVLIFVILVMIMKEFEDNVATIAGSIGDEFGSGVGLTGFKNKFNQKVNEAGNKAASAAMRIGKGKQPSSKISAAHSATNRSGPRS